ncbi:hypothetical protein R3P38DRAFT_1460891 [Favolaschia claudopus]|uniref:Uncharacterized protein n=1 Tax=Favolaschia claudopus TaxID=2862362 RepID=A0AAW0DPS4_9AGAR
MNNEQYLTAILDELRGFTGRWIEGLRGIRQQQALLRMPIPYPSYPLPQQFPFGDFQLSETFEWIHEYGRQQLRHVHSVRFIFQGRTNGPNSSVAWRIDNTHGTALGIFEIAASIYVSQSLPFRINEDLILEGMSASLATHEPMRLISRVVVVANPDPRRRPRRMRVYELQSGVSNPTRVRILGSAYEP